MDGAKFDRVRSRKHAAEILNMSPRTFSRMESRGLLPPRIQISERIFGYRDSDLNKWLDARKAPSRAPAISWQKQFDDAFGADKSGGA
jgi:predicted DNA-binding transcriptional regulator AlpA